MDNQASLEKLVSVFKARGWHAEYADHSHFMNDGKQHPEMTRVDVYTSGQSYTGAQITIRPKAVMIVGYLSAADWDALVIIKKWRKRNGYAEPEST